jgi:hypothetical protein
MQHCAECCFGSGIEATNEADLRIMLLARDAADEIKRLRAEVERLRDEKATLRRNEWRLIWGLCTECGANRDKEARRG